MTTEAQRRLISELSDSIAAIEQSRAPEPAHAIDEDDSVLRGDGKAPQLVDDDARAYQKLIDLASYREHSTATMAKRLKRAGFEEGPIAAAIERAQSSGIIDDRRYADMLIRDRLASGKGLEPIWREISALGIDPESLDAYEEYASLPSDGEQKRAYAFLDRHPTRSKNLRAGAYRKLVQQGFSTAVASTVSKAWARDRLSMES